MKFIKLTMLIISVFCINSIYAAAPPSVKQFINNKDWNFVENKGQLPLLSKGAGGLNTDIKYYGHQGGVYLYCKPGMLSFVFTKVENQPQQISEATGQPSGFPLSRKGAGGFGPRPPLSALRSSVSTSRTDLILLNSNPDAQIIATDQLEYYENYYTTGDADHGITNVHTFKTVTYKDVYPHIDMVLHCKESGMKYEFLVHPGGKVSDIQMQWNGLQNMQMTEDGGIKYATALGKMEEGRPISFQGKVKVESSFLKHNDLINFSLRKYKPNENLVIDPTLLWATYFGSNGHGNFYGNSAGNADNDAVDIDDSDNIYITGYTQCTGLGTTGSFQSNFAGSLDCIVTMFTSNGSCKWTSYYGGKGIDNAFAIKLDKFRNIYITGATASDSGIATSGAYQTSYNNSPGYREAFLAEFTNTGKLKWASYFGGGQYSETITSGISVDTEGNPYITGSTYSTTEIASKGSFISSYTNTLSQWDGFLAKFTNTGKFKWGTYFGGDKSTSCNAISSDQLGNIYITGTTSSDIGISTSGSYQVSISGTNSNNGFLAQFDSSGSLKWGTYYGGVSTSSPSTGTELASIAVDLDNNIYISGTSACTSGIATSGSFKSYYTDTINNFAWEAVLIKFNPAGKRLWGTYYGTEVDFGNSVCVDKENNVYMFGQTQDTSGIASPGAYQSVYSSNGDADAFIAKFNSVGKRLYGTYAGKGNCQAGIAGSNGNCFLVGASDSDFKTTIGAYQTKYSGGYNDALISAYNLNYKHDAGISAIISPVGNLCAGNYPVKVQLKNYGSNELDSVTIGVYGDYGDRSFKWKGKLSPDSTTIVYLDSMPVGSVYQTGYSQAIRAWTSAPNGIIDSFRENDTTKISDSVISPSSVYSVTVGKCGVVLFQASPLSTSPTPITSYEWIGNVGKGTDSFTLSGRTASYQYRKSGNFKYSLKVIGQNGCTATYNDALGLKPIFPTISLPDDTTICSNSEITIKAVPASFSGSYNIWWNLKDSKGDSITTSSVTETFTKDIVLRVNIQNQGCTNYDSMKIHILAAPRPDLGSNLTKCKGNLITLSTHLKTLPITKWFLITIKNDTVKNYATGDSIIAKVSGLYIVAVEDSYGCKGSDSALITINPNPIANLSYTSVCPTDSTPFSDTSSSANSYSWSFGDGSTSSLQNPKHLYAANGTYNVNLKVSNSVGCADSANQKITISDCVWPGDANDDKIVDMRDFLAIGIAYGDTGLPRPSASISWTGQTCPNWKDTIPGGINAKHSDCNGDSIVNYGDTTAISLNYGQSHSKSSPIIQGSPGDPGFVITPLSDSVSIGKIFQTSISMGSQKNPVQNLYGMAFSIFADPALFETDKASIKVIPSFFGTDSVDLMDMKINNISNGTIDLGFTRIDHTNASGYGTFAILSIPVKATIPQKNIKTSLSISNNTQISYNGKNIPLYFSSDSTVVTQHTTAINPTSQFLSGLNIYPNPFSSSASVQYTLLKSSRISIALFDITGKQVGIIADKNQSAGQYSLEINAEKYHLYPGVYLLKFMTEDGFVSREIVKF